MSVDLLIIGGGPAGCAAAAMAGSLGLGTVLVEQRTLCHKLRHVASVVNALGGPHTGSELAAAIEADVARTERCQVLLGERVTTLHSHERGVTARLDSGRALRASVAVLATGVQPLYGANWLDLPSGGALKPLWEAGREEVRGRTALVLGADRPLGTWLRAHPHLDVTFLVLHTAAEAYKIEEVRGDRRVEAHEVKHVQLSAGHSGFLARTPGDTASEELRAQLAYLNLGAAPHAPAGDAVTDDDGYCRPELQQPRLLVAGDLRGARFQRIMTAYGSGAEAALRVYYQRNGLL